MSATDDGSDKGSIESRRKKSMTPNGDDQFAFRAEPVGDGCTNKETVVSGSFSGPDGF